MENIYGSGIFEHIITLEIPNAEHVSTNLVDKSFELIVYNFCRLLFVSVSINILWVSRGLNEFQTLWNVRTSKKS